MAHFTPWKLSSQKLGFFLVTFGFIWGMMLLHFTIQQRTPHESSTVLREQILDLSKRYIKALAEENRNVVDGPYVGTMTAYGKDETGRAASERRGDVSLLRLRFIDNLGELHDLWGLSAISPRQLKNTMNWAIWL